MQLKRVQSKGHGARVSSAMTLRPFASGPADAAATSQTVLQEVLLCVALSLGGWGVFALAFALPCVAWAFWPLVVLCPVGLYFLRRQASVGKYMGFYGLMLIALLVAAFYAGVYQGCLVLCNGMLACISSQTDATYLLYSTTGGAGEATFALALCVPASALLIARGVADRRPALPLLATAALLVPPVACGVAVPLWAFALALLGGVGLIVHCLSHAGKKAARGSLRLAATGGTKGGYRMLALFLGVAVAFVVAMALLYPVTAYQPAQAVDAARQGILDAANDLRYQTAADIDTLPQGDLKNATSLAYTDNTALVVEMEQPHALYLRGFVGADYADDAWSATADAAYAGEYAGLLEWLVKRDFYPWCQSQSVWAGTQEAQASTVTVKNTALSSREVYLPYDALTAGDVSPDAVCYDKDRGATSRGVFGDREYTFETYLPYSKDYATADFAPWLEALWRSADYEAYAESERAYRAFVYDTYTDLPDDAQAALSRCFSADTLAQLQTASLSDAVHTLRQYFSDNLTYSYDLSPLAEEGALDAFLNRTHTGYDCHFATAAALLLRQAGIPTRYVEGYTLSPDEMDMYEPMRDVRFLVTDTFAHAWVEVYVDELGWLPIEVVPGFYELEEQPSREETEVQAPSTIDRHLYVDDIPVESPPPAPQQDTPAAQSRFPGWLLALILAVVLLALAVAALLLRGRRRWRRTQAAWEGPANAAALCLYGYVARCMALEGVTLGDLPTLQRAAVYETFEGDVCDGFDEFVRLTYRARYSTHTLDEEQRASMRQYAQSVAGCVYMRQSWAGKWKMRWLRGLYGGPHRHRREKHWQG